MMMVEKKRFNKKIQYNVLNTYHTRMCVRYSESPSSTNNNNTNKNLMKEMLKEEREKNQNWMNELLDVELFSHDQR